LELLSLAEDIASAMAYLHPTVVHRCAFCSTHHAMFLRLSSWRAGACHVDRDLKSQNVLLDRMWRAKARARCAGVAMWNVHSLLCAGG
jgi:hypothetical protein